MTQHLEIDDPGAEAPPFPSRARRRLAAAVLLGVFVAVLGVWWGSRLGSTGGPPPAVGGSAIEAPVRDAETSAPTVVRDLADMPPGVAERVLVVYFHRTHRCWSCTEAERLTRRALSELYPDQLADGRIELVVADVENAENAEIVARFEAWSSSLYLEVTKNGQAYVYPVADIWFNIADPERYVSALGRTIAAASGGL